MIRIGIVGASGFTGAELVRLLANHPQAEIEFVTSETYAGQRLSDVYPALARVGEHRLVSLATVGAAASKVDAVFLALPHGESMAAAPGWLKQGVKVIDLSGDFRFRDTAVYESWYKRPHTEPGLAQSAVYGMPELFRPAIKNAALLANPGCFVTAAVLALYPLVKSGMADLRTLVVDAKTSPSGAGRKAKAESMFTTVSENVIPYKLTGTHQHTPEMEMALSRIAGREVAITFTPQLVPARRGILAAAYVRLVQGTNQGDLQELYQDIYRHEPFVRVRPSEGAWPDLASAVGSNLCVIKVGMDARTGLAVVVSSIDNLIKGASGQAVQNMNLMFGLDETLGLPEAGMVP